jgi:anti-sigma-K factor RskA
VSSVRERLEDLLVQRATEGIDAREADELARLLDRNPEVDAQAFDRVAAVVHAACLPRAEPLPPRLRARLDAAASRFVDRPANRIAQPLESTRQGAERQRPWAWLAVAAAVVLAVAGWWPRIAPPRSVAAERAALVAAGAARLSWMATQDPAAVGATGDVVWDAASQRGFMRFVGLAVNEPARVQYQLWIFDAARDQRYPVDGGVFDIPAGETEVIVPIRANLPVKQAKMFAVTVEQPGGVVVSSRERIVAVAQAG